MRSRWQEWVIVLGIVTLAGTGIGAIWGDDIVRIFSSAAADRPAPSGSAPAPEPTPAPSPPVPTTPPGSAADSI